MLSSAALLSIWNLKRTRWSVPQVKKDLCLNSVSSWFYWISGWDYIFRGFEPYFSKEHLYMLIVIKFDELTITKL
jgi:hypothetical protein